MINNMYYTLEQHLESFKDVSQDYSEIYACWLLDKKSVGKALNAVSHFYPHYSDHDESHSRKLIKNIEMLLGVERIKTLSPTDTWMILMCAYLHDSGMILVNDILSEKWSAPDFQNFLRETAESSYDKYDEEYIEAAKYLLFDYKKDENSDWPLKVRYYVILIAAEYFRRSHGEYSKTALNALEKYGLNVAAFQKIPNRIKNLIGQIAFLHGRDFKEVLELDHKAIGIGIDLIHPRFVSMMIRLGDLLDLDDGRFTAIFQKMMHKIPDISEVHMGKHASITHLLIDSEGIEISANCSTPEIYRATKSWIDWLDDEIKNLATNWLQIVQKDFEGGPPRLNKQNLFLRGKKDKSEQANLRFNISVEKAFDILEGAEIYDTELVFIRELVQNALDASKIQMWIDICDGVYENILYEEKKIKSCNDIKTLDDIPAAVWKVYSIKIIIDIDEITSEVVFSIEDRGCGFTMQDLVRFTKIGESWKDDEEKSKVIRTMPNWLRPTGAFGLGIQSLFLVTGEIEIYTKPNNESAKKITAVSRRKNGYITVEEQQGAVKRGSKIKFRINNDTCKRIVEKNLEVDAFISKVHYKSVFINMIKKEFEAKISDKFFPIFYNGQPKKGQQFYWNKKYELDELKNVKYSIEYNLSDKNPFINIVLLDMDLGSYFEMYTFKEGKPFISNLNANREILFRGVKVRNPDLLYDYIQMLNRFFQFRFDILSSETKYYLKIARTEFKNESIFKLKNEIHKNVVNALMLFREKKFLNCTEKEKLIEFIKRNEESYSIGPIVYLILAYILIENIDIDKKLIETCISKAFSAIIYENSLEHIDESLVFSNDNILIVKLMDSDDYEVALYNKNICLDLYKYFVESDTYIKQLNEEVKAIYFYSDSIYLLYLNKYFYIENILQVQLSSGMKDNLKVFFDDEELSLEDIKYFEIIRIKKKNNNKICMSNGLDKNMHNKIIYSLNSKDIAYFMNRSIIYPIYPYGQILSVNKLPNDFEVKDRNGSNIFINGNSFIISPFVLDEIIPFELETEDLIQWLKDNMGLNELAKWVVDNSAQPEQYRPNLEQVIKSYESLIEEYHRIFKSEN